MVALEARGQQQVAEAEEQEAVTAPKREEVVVELEVPKAQMLLEAEGEVQRASRSRMWWRGWTACVRLAAEEVSCQWAVAVASCPWVVWEPLSVAQEEQEADLPVWRARRLLEVEERRLWVVWAPTASTHQGLTSTTSLGPGLCRYLPSSSAWACLRRTSLPAVVRRPCSDPMTVPGRCCSLLGSHAQAVRVPQAVLVRPCLAQEARLLPVALLLRLLMIRRL